jgi:hypothetical protein
VSQTGLIRHSRAGTHAVTRGLFCAFSCSLSLWERAGVRAPRLSIFRHFGFSSPALTLTLSRQREREPTSNAVKLTLIRTGDDQPQRAQRFLKDCANNFRLRHVSNQVKKAFSPINTGASSYLFNSSRCRGTARTRAAEIFSSKHFGGQQSLPADVQRVAKNIATTMSDGMTANH